MIKFLIIITVAAGLIGFTGPGQKLTANIFEVVNPMAQERKLLTDLQKHVDGISTTINGSEFQKLSDTQKLQKMNTLINQTKTKTHAVRDAIHRGDLVATTSLLIQKITSTSSIADTQNNNSQEISPKNNCPQ